MQSERARRRRSLVLGVIAGALVWLFGAGAPVTADGGARAAVIGQPTESIQLIEQPPDETDGDEGEGDGDGDEEGVPDDGEEPTDDEPTDDEPAPEPGEVPIVVWMGAGALVLVAILWAVRVATD